MKSKLTEERLLAIANELSKKFSKVLKKSDGPKLKSIDVASVALWWAFGVTYTIAPDKRDAIKLIMGVLQEVSAAEGIALAPIDLDSLREALGGLEAPKKPDPTTAIRTGERGN